METAFETRQTLKNIGGKKALSFLSSLLIFLSSSFPPSRGSSKKLKKLYNKLYNTQRSVECPTLGFGSGPDLRVMRSILV